jgi:hypothetical protein
MMELLMDQKKAGSADGKDESAAIGMHGVGAAVVAVA